jgi:uncharacterized protein
MSTFVFRLKAPRPTFALDMSDEEREIMARHAGHWRPWVESGQMVIFGPVLDGSGSWGLGVVEADDEEELRAFAADDPVVTTGTGTIEVGKMLGGFVRPRPGPLAPGTSWTSATDPPARHARHSVRVRLRSRSWRVRARICHSALTTHCDRHQAYCAVVARDSAGPAARIPPGGTSGPSPAILVERRMEVSPRAAAQQHQHPEEGERP